MTDADKKLDLPAELPKYYAQIKDRVQVDERKRVPEGLLSNEDAYESGLAITQGRVAALRSAIQAN